MHIIKSLHGGILHKTFAYQGQHVFALTALWSFRLSDGRPVIEQKMWGAIADSMEEPSMLDMAMPKENAEFLVRGACIAPGGKAIDAAQVRVRLADREKRINIFGDRHWVKAAGIGLTPSRPQSFSRMPINFGRAFGGEGHAPNPFGKGFRPVVDEDGIETLPLPNLERPGQIIGAPDDRPRPISFDPLDITLESRRKLGGTYDDKYIRERMPGLPDDIDWAFFQDAQEDQRFEGKLAGTEPYEIEFMNAEHSLLKGTLPGVRARLFIRRLDSEGEPEFRELKGEIDTIWFLPEQDLGVVFERATIGCQDPQGEDITGCLTAHEGHDDPRRSLEHYEDQFTKRTDPEESYKYLINTQDLLPLGVGCAIEEIKDDFGMDIEVANYDLNMRFNDTQMEKASEETAKAEAQIRAAGENLDPASKAKLDARLDNPEPPTNPDVERFKAIAEKIVPGATTDPRNIDISKIDLKAFDDLKAFSKEVQDKELKKARDELQKAITELDGVGSEADSSRAKLKQVLEEIELPPLLPRVELGDAMIKIRESLSQVEAERERLRSLGATPEQLERLDIKIDDVEKQIRDAQIQARKGYRDGAHFIGPSRSPHAGQEAAIAQQLKERLSKGETVSTGDYAFCDLRDLDLRGADLSDSYLEYADLRGADLTGANLSGCVLTHAKLAEALFKDVNLSNANLGGSDFSATRFENCEATGTRFARGRLINTRFLNTTIADCQDAFLECEADALHMEGCSLRAQNFIELTLANSEFKNCDLSECNWLKPVLDNCRFDGCKLESSSLVEARIGKGHFHDCEMRNVRFVGGCSITDASFARSVLDTGNLMGCDLHSARFSGAALNETVFNNSDLSEARFDGVVARRAMFNSCELQGAKLPKADFFEASFYKARMLKADFRGSNLYGANLMEVTLGETRFQGANLKQTILKDWRPLT